MKIKYLYLTFGILLLIQSNVIAQKSVLKSITINEKGIIQECRILMSSSADTFTLVVNGDGKLLGIEFSPYTNLSEYNYFDEYADLEIQSKLSEISESKVKYYSTIEDKNKQSKISKLGDFTIDFYVADPDKASKVYKAGNLILNYYTRSNGYNTTGKLSKIGDITFEYFTNTADIEKQGKIMKAGDYEFDFYTQYDNEKKAGNIKSVGGNDGRFRLILVSSCE